MIVRFIVPCSTGFNPAATGGSPAMQITSKFPNPLPDGLGEGVCSIVLLKILSDFVDNRLID